MFNNQNVFDEATRLCRAGAAKPRRFMLWFIVAMAALAVPLHAQTLDELLDLESPATQPTEARPTGGEVGGVEPGSAMDRRLSAEQAADAFDQAVEAMGRAAARLGDNADAGLDTQRVQEEVLAKLDQIIESAQQQQSESSSSSSSSSSSQAQNQDSQAQNAGQNQPGDSKPGQTQPGQAQAQAQAQSDQQSPGGENSDRFSPGQGGPNDPQPRSLDEVRSEWGNLPPRLRDELTNGLDEPYSPVYRRLTEDYYRRLAEEAE